MIPTKFRFIWQSGFRGEDFFRIQPIMFVNGSGRNERYIQRTFHRCFLPSLGSFSQTVAEEKNVKNQPIRNKNHMWRPCLLADRDEISNLYRGSSIDASYQVSVHLAKLFQRRRLFKICIEITAF